MPIPWNEDPPGAAPLIERNLATRLRRLIMEAAGRGRPKVDLAREWHREIFDGVKLPVSYYAGEFRDDDPRYPELLGYEVRVGSRPGVPAREHGRTARLWANGCALRYGLPPFVRLRPHPQGLHYARAATDSMRGDHRATVSLFADWLEERLRLGEGSAR